ncbi:MAG: hypothetical protein QXL89_03740 [Nitrososphaeria archaeon]
MDKIKQFLIEWFGCDGRELGTPERFYTQEPSKLLELVSESRTGKLPVYVSVQPYRGRDFPCAIEKLFFDFDCKENLNHAWEDATKFIQALKEYYNAVALPMFSGRKGYHVYVFFKQPIYFEPQNLDFAKEVYKLLQEALVKGLSLPTLDRQVLGDIKRLARAPFSRHEESGRHCLPMARDRMPTVPEDLDSFRTLDPKLIAVAVKQVRELLAIRLANNDFRPDSGIKCNIRPCIMAALEKALEGANGHLMRLAITREYLSAGYSVDEIVQLFRRQPDFNERKTHYYVEYAANHSTRPFKCETIKQLGYCINCKRFYEDSVQVELVAQKRR